MPSSADGTLNRATWETIAAAQQSRADAGHDRRRRLGAAAWRSELAAAGVAEVLVVERPALDRYTPDAYVAALAALIAQASRRCVLLPHTYQTRDFAPLLAARLGAPLVTDVTGITGVGG